MKKRLLAALMAGAMARTMPACGGGAVYRGFDRQALAAVFPKRKAGLFVWCIQHHRHRTVDRPETGDEGLSVRYGMDKSFRRHQLDGYPEKGGRVVCRASGSGEPRSL